MIGGGQAGLAAAYYLKQAGIPFVVLDAAARIGDAWRNRWDSLRLFTPRRYNGLPGLPFPQDGDYFPSKDEMADFLEDYADRFEVPVRTSTPVDGLTRNGDRFGVRTPDGTIRAQNVIVSIGTFQVPRVPPFAARLDPGILQFHSAQYRNPGQLRNGPVLVVGAGNSGAEIAMDVARLHETTVAGRSTGQLPFRIDSQVGRAMTPLALRLLFHRILTIDTPMGRKARPVVLSRGGPLIRTRSTDLARAGVKRIGRVKGVAGGRPVVDDGTPLAVANVIWCTGFEPGFSWIDLPIMGDHEPHHRAGIVEGEPGLYFLGLEFLYAMSSAMVQGVGRDAARVVSHLAERRQAVPV